MTPPPQTTREQATPAQWLQRLEIFRERFRLGLIDEPKFKEISRAFQFQDDLGHIWMPGATSNQWYRWDRSQWTAAAPPEKLTAHDLPAAISVAWNIPIAAPPPRALPQAAANFAPGAAPTPPVDVPIPPSTSPTRPVLPADLPGRQVTPQASEASKGATPSGNPFIQVEEQYFILRGKLEASRITREQFERALKELMVEDAQGRFWMLGVESARWYAYDGRTWVEATPPGMARQESRPPAPVRLPPPASQLQSAPPKKSRKIPAIIATIGGGLLTLLVGIAVTWGQGVVRSALLGSPATVTLVPTTTLAPTMTLVARVPTPQVIVITATPLPTAMSTQTNAPTATRTLTSVPRTATPFPPGAIPTFPASVVTWSTGYDETAGKPINIVANKLFSPAPLDIYASWTPTGIAVGTKLQIAWYYAGAVWAQTEYALEAANEPVWHSASRTDRKPLTPGNYRLEIKVDGKVILTDEGIVR